MTNLDWIEQIQLPSVFAGSQVYVTKADYNLSLNVGEPGELVQLRRHALEHFVETPIAWLNQVHGAQAHVFNSNLPEATAGWPNKDASVTVSKQIGLAVLAADCLPVVFYTAGGQPTIGVAHAGWKGLAAGVLQNCAQQVAGSSGVPVDLVQAWMGPAIGPRSFEVGLEVKQRFLSVSSAYLPAFRDADLPSKVYANLYHLASIALNALGVTVYGGGLDTLTNGQWFSHRGALQHCNRSVGRFATIIRLDKKT